MQIVEPDPAAIWQFPGIFPVPKNIRNGDLASEVALKVSGRELPVSVQRSLKKNSVGLGWVDFLRLAVIAAAHPRNVL